MADSRPCWLKVLDRLPDHVRANLNTCVKCDVDLLIGCIPEQFSPGLDESAYDSPREMVLNVISRIKVQSGHDTIQAELERLCNYLGGARCGCANCTECPECSAYSESRGGATAASRRVGEAIS